MSSAQSSIIKTLLYFDIFDYPLNAVEIFNLVQLNNVSLKNIQDELSLLSILKFIQKDGEFYGLPGNNFNTRIKLRKKGNHLAISKLKKAKLFSFLIACCPFVKAVSLSGTISKGYMKKDSDIDYFIITKPGRLWIARTILTLFKKLFLLNSYKYFCINYFIDEDHLEIPDKNIFTATELAYLLPVYNYETYLKLKQKNLWIMNFLPNFPNRNNKYLIKYKNFIIKTWIEKLLDFTFANTLERFCFKISKNYFEKKYNYIDHDVKSLVTRHKKYVSKLHPNNFQEKVIKQLTTKTNHFELKHNIRLMQFDHKL